MTGCQRGAHAGIRARHIRDTVAESVRFEHCTDDCAIDDPIDVFFLPVQLLHQLGLMPEAQ